MKPYWMILLAIPLMGFTFLDPVAKKNQEGNDLFQKGEYEEALKRYREAQVEDQNRPELHFNTGSALYKQGDYTNALQEFSKALESQTTSLMANGFYNLGNVYYHLEKFSEAVGAYKKSLELNSDDLDAKINLELALEKLKDKQKQEDQKPPEPSEYAKELKAQAEALVKQNQYRAAYDLMMEGSKVDPTVGIYQDFIKRIKDVVDIEALL